MRIDVVRAREFFFFQAEDGIRDYKVTGVQTCAFFFSSRRRHTRLQGDWSSDVCSSDLVVREQRGLVPDRCGKVADEMRNRGTEAAGHPLPRDRFIHPRAAALEIGRASCRERV